MGYHSAENASTLIGISTNEEEQAVFVVRTYDAVSDEGMDTAEDPFQNAEVESLRSTMSRWRRLGRSQDSSE